MQHWGEYARIRCGEDNSRTIIFYDFYSVLFAYFGLSDGNRYQDDGNKNPSAVTISNKHARHLEPTRRHLQTFSDRLDSKTAGSMLFSSVFPWEIFRNSMCKKCNDH
jgi:hypothetical protein